METAFDLSQSGETTVPFRQTCSSSHGEVVCLKCDVPDAAKENSEKFFKGLSGSVVIKDSRGSTIQYVKITAETTHYFNGEIMLAGFAPFSKGDYVATIRVDSGAAGLAGKPQTIYAKYQLCGLEQLPAVIMGVLAAGAGLVALISAVCVLPGLLRRGFWRDVPVEVAQKE